MSENNYISLLVKMTVVCVEFLIFLLCDLMFKSNLELLWHLLIMQRPQ